MTETLEPEAEDLACRCEAYERAPGSINPFGAVPVCVCAHSAAWHQEQTGACTYN
jgi:hypothetical protein